MERDSVSTFILTTVICPFPLLPNLSFLTSHFESMTETARWRNNCKDAFSNLLLCSLHLQGDTWESLLCCLSVYMSSFIIDLLLRKWNTCSVRHLLMWLPVHCFPRGAEVSDCGRYLVISVRQGCDPVNRLYYTDLSTLPDGINGILPYVKVVDNFDAEYEVRELLFC